MVICAVYGCNNSYKNKSVSMYRFPTNENVAKQWLNECKRLDRVNMKTARMCSIHFKEEDYMRNLKHELLNYCPKNGRKLKPNCVPSLNLPRCSDQNKKAPRTARLNNRNNRILVQQLLSQESQPSTDPESHQQNKDSIASECFDEKINASTIEIKALSNKIELLEQENQTLKEQVSRLNQHISKLERGYANIKKIFTEGQIKKLENNGARIVWSKDDISAAISLHCVSSKCYRFLRRKLEFPLPSPSTLACWARKINCSPGLLTDVLTVMEAVGKNIETVNKLTVLSFDEMKICEKVCYDKANDIVIGPCKYVQVVMARGIVGNWKQPIFYDFDCKMTESILFEIVNSMEAAGYPVVAIVSDMGGSNQGLWKQLKIVEEQVFFLNPVNSKPIYVFADVPHLIKLLRNHFLDSGLVIDNCRISKEIIVELLTILKDKELKIAHKLGSHHLTVKGAERQKVKHATQLFSNSVSSALLFCGNSGMLTNLNANNWRKCADIFKLVNDWFDVFNVQRPEADQRERVKAYGLALDTQNRILENMKCDIKKMRTKFGKKCMLPFQKGIVVSIMALQSLYTYLHEQYNIKYILTYRLNQDVLENFFSNMRSAGGLHDHPLPTEFSQRIKRYVLSKHENFMSKGANTETDGTKKLNLFTNLEAVTTSHNKPKNKDVLSEEINDLGSTSDVILASLLFDELFGEDSEPHINPVEEPEELVIESEDIIKNAGITYIAGYLAFRARNTHRHLGNPTAYFPQASSPGWIQQVSEGGLIQPTDEFIEEVKIMETQFLKYNADGNINKNKNYVANLSALIMPSVKLADLNIVKIFIRTRLFIRIKDINAHIEEERRLKQFQNKMKKTCS